VILQLVLLVLMRSLAIYWQHRLAHAVPFLWQFHKFHHSASVMTGLNDYRGTPLTIAMTGSWVLVVAQLFGSVDASRGGLATAVAAFLFMVFRFATELNAHVIHSRVDSTYGWFGRFVFASPGYHRIHHSALPEHRDRNFCTDFVLWDWLFGTQVDPKYVTDRANIPLGFDDNPYDRGSLVYDYFFRPARDAIASLRPGATRNRVTATGNPAA
jgi:sterol desaturase/sphingolipid hydroxylase (fatty acid hydroxylase superfamily)